MKNSMITSYTVKECCTLLKISRNKLLELLWNKELEGFRIGRQWRITEQAIQDFIFYHVH